MENKDEKLKKLTKLQFDVTQNDHTEAPFSNEFNDHKKKGIYVDIVSGELLFTSIDKFDSGCGWPSFDRPAIEKSIIENEDLSLACARIEVRSKDADSHLGHVFTDGPTDTGLRYCINSASLEFIDFDDLESKGYGEFKSLFVKEGLK